MILRDGLTVRGLFARSASIEAVIHRAAEPARCRNPSGTRCLASSVDSCWDDMALVKRPDVNIRDNLNKFRTTGWVKGK